MLAAGAMLSAGAVDQLLLDGSRTVYGVVFVLASVACAIWVRPADLVAAPVAAPIAFAAGLLVTANPMGMVTGLALRAGWLYGGTLTAVLIVLIRKRLLHTARRPVSPR